MTRLVVMNGHKKETCVTMELDHVFKTQVPTRFKCEHNWEIQYEHSKKKTVATLNSHDFCISTHILELE